MFFCLTFGVHISLRVLTLVSTSYSLLIFDSKILNRKGIYLSLTVQIIATFTRCENE